jgi:hypothetical protein
MPRRAGWRPGCLAARGAAGIAPLPLPLPRWPSAAAAAPQLVSLAPWGALFACLCEVLNFLAVDSGSVVEKGGYVSIPK